MTALTVKIDIAAPVQTVREKRTTPEDIMQRNFAADDRACPHAVNDLRVGGQFSYTMAAKDGSFSFEYAGTYTAIEEHKYIEFVL